MRIHIFEIERKIYVRFGSLITPITHISSAAGSMVIIKTIRAQAAKSLAKKIFNVF